MTTTNIILLLTMLLTATALLWLGAYEVGFAAALKRERALADRRVQGVLDELRRKPTARKATKLRAKRRAA